MNQTQPVIPTEGIHVLHLFYHVDHAQWLLLSERDRIAAKTRLSEIVQEARATERTQLLTFSIVTPKADLGFMLLTPDLQTANRIEKQLTLSLGPDILTPSFSYLSITERNEYATSPEEHTLTIEKKDALEPGTPEHEAESEASAASREMDPGHPLYPTLPDWPVFCFYPMSKRRAPGQNWYTATFEQRKRLMAGHARVGRMYSGRILQLTTGSTGLDDAEWGVTLFARNTFDVKAIVYEMRFDAVSAEYDEFGEFYIGLQLPLDELFRRLQI